MKKFLILSVGLVLCVTDLVGQDIGVADEELGFRNPDESFRGWDRSIRLSGNLLLNDNTSVVGQTDGLSTTLGYKLNSNLEFHSEHHEWRNLLSFEQSFSRDPSLKEFVKTSDLLKIESLYLYYFWKWIGPFARFRLSTPALDGNDVRSSDTTYVVPGEQNQVSKKFKLTDGFKPLELKQSIGAFAKPIRRDELNVEVLGGLGFLEIFAKDQFSLSDDDSTPEVELARLRNVYQLGFESALSVFGEASQPNWTYRAYAETLVPFINNKAKSDDRSVLDLTNMEFGVDLGFELNSWMMLSYNFKAVKQPQILDKFQISTALALNLGLDLIASRKSSREI